MSGEVSWACLQGSLVCVFRLLNVAELFGCMLQSLGCLIRASGCVTLMLLLLDCIVTQAIDQPHRLTLANFAQWLFPSLI